MSAILEWLFHVAVPAFVKHLPQVLSKLAQKLIRPAPGKVFWQVLLNGVPRNKTIPVFLSAKPGYDVASGRKTRKPGHTVLISYNEVLAFLGLQRSLQQIKRISSLVHSGTDLKDTQFSIPGLRGDETFVIIGSLHANTLCRRILLHEDLPQLPFRFGMKNTVKCIDVYQDENGEWGTAPTESFPPSTDEANSDREAIEKDYGIILRISNPIDRRGRSKVLILGGNHGFGTESAVNYVAGYENAGWLHDRVREHDFELLFEASTDPDKGLSLDPLRLAISEGSGWAQVNVS